MSTVINLQGKQSWNLEQQLSEQDKFLRVPIAVLGKWKHPEYGEVEFSQKDFDEIITNYQSDAVGYEPPLFVGHPNNLLTEEGAPSVGFLEKLYQKDNVLYGLFEPVDELTFKEVEKGSYRYSSAEVIRNAFSKRTGENIGTVLRGAALTNRPFLTGMPKVEALHQQFSEKESDQVTFLIPLESKTMTTEQQLNQPLVEEKEVAEAVKAKSTASKEEQVVTGVSSVEVHNLSEKLVNITVAYEDLKKKYEMLEQNLSEATSRLNSRDQEIMLERLQHLNVSSETKETFSEVLKTGSLSREQINQFWEKLQKTAQANQQRYSEQQGSVDAEAIATETSFVNPYARVIEQNEEIYSDLRKSRFQR